MEILLVILSTHGYPPGNPTLSNDRILSRISMAILLVILSFLYGRITGRIAMEILQVILLFNAGPFCHW